VEGRHLKEDITESSEGNNIRRSGKKSRDPNVSNDDESNDFNTGDNQGKLNNTSNDVSKDEPIKKR